MTLVQTHFRGRRDCEALNSVRFDYDPDTSWTQQTDAAFRVRFEVQETSGSAATVGGTLEARVNGGSWTPVTTSAGTVAAAYSPEFSDEAQTVQVLGRGTATFAAGEGSQDGVAAPLSLAGQVTELEYSVRISSGGTVDLRIAGLDTYEQYPTLVAVETPDLTRVRIKIGDTNDSDRLLTDPEIYAFIAAWPDNVNLAAADAAEAIAAKFARDFNFSADGQSFNRRERVLHYTELARSLRRAGYLIWP